MNTIKKVTTYVLYTKLENPFSFSQWTYDTRATCLVSIETTDGVVGWGECYGPSMVIQKIIVEMKEYLIGEDPLDIERHWEYLYNRYRDFGQKGLIIEAISGIDIALWDIMGKTLNLPIHKLMGGAFRTQVQAYATGFYPVSDNPIAQLEKEAYQYLEEGFQAMKMKVGFGVKKDYEYVKTVYKVIKDKAELMIDANHAYDALDAIKLGKKIEKFDIAWFEEPVTPENIRGYQECKQALNIPIAGGECEFTRFGFREVLEKRCVDIIQPDTCSAGGLSECKKIAALANAYGVRYNPHAWGTAIGLSASLQLLAILPYNPLSINPRHPMLELDQTEHPFRMEIITEPITHKKGIVDIPVKPGLGIEVNKQVVEKYTINKE